MAISTGIAKNDIDSFKNVFQDVSTELSDKLTECQNYTELLFRSPEYTCSLKEKTSSCK